MSDELTIFCNNIKQIRKRNRLTKDEMAEIMGISTATLSNIEKGVVPPKLKLDTLCYTANYFHYCPYELFSSLL